MYRTMLLTALCTLTLAATGHAASPSQTALAEELMSLMKVKETMEKSFEAVKQMVPRQIQQMGVAPEGLEKKKAAMELTMDIISQEMSWEKIKDEMAAVYAEVLTAEELKGLIAFYGSPIGRRFTEKQPELMARSMQITQKRMMVVMPMIKKRIEEMKAQRSEP